MHAGFVDDGIIDAHERRRPGCAAPCRILQGGPLGNIFKQSLREVWYGEGYAQFRRELVPIMKRGAEWQPDPAVDKTVVGMCGGKGTEVCPIKSFYYKADIRFLRELNAMIAS